MTQKIYEKKITRVVGAVALILLLSVGITACDTDNDISQKDTMENEPSDEHTDQNNENNTEDNTQNNTGDNTEDNNQDNTGGNTEDNDQGNTGDNTEDNNQGNTGGNTEDNDQGNTGDNTEDNDQDTTGGNTESGKPEEDKLSAKLRDLIVNGELASAESKYHLSQIENFEILSIELGEPHNWNYGPIYVYAAFPINDTEKLYARFSFEARETVYSQLKNPENYSTYEQFAVLVTDFLCDDSSRCFLQDAWAAEAKDLELDNQDLPGDADGFAYDFKIAAAVHNALINISEKISPNFFDKIYNIDPEILFIELGEQNYNNFSPIFVYAAFPINETEKVYTKFEFEGAAAAYRKLMNPENFLSYAQFASLAADAVWNGTYKNAWEAKAMDFHNMIESGTTKLAAIIDEKFVDVDINFVCDYKDDELGWCYEIDGFGYDIEGNAFNFTSMISYPMDSGLWKNFINSVANGVYTSNDMGGVKTTSSRIDSVFRAFIKV